MTSEWVVNGERRHVTLDNRGTPRGYGEYGERKALHHSLRPEPSPYIGVIKLIHMRCLAFSCAESVLCYRALLLICTSLCAIINHSTSEEGRRRFRRRVRRGRRKAGCCAMHITMHFLLSSINQRGADCAAGGGAGLVVCYVYHVHYHQQYRIQVSAGSARETQKAGGVLLCSSVLHSYVKSYIAGGGAVLPCTIMNNYRSTRRTRRVFQLLQGLRYFK